MARPVMRARPLLPLLAAVALACAAALWIAFEGEPSSAEAVERRGLPAPLSTSSAPVESLPSESGRMAPLVPAGLPPPIERTVEPTGEQPGEPPERDPLVVGAVPRPEPGDRHAPIATEYYENGQMMYEAHQRALADGSWLLDGPWNSWHENGEMQEQGAYRDEREHGRWQWWADNGQQVAVGDFDNGVREGPWSFWHENGYKLMDATYANGEGAGRWTMYHENGRRAAEGEYRDGGISGYWTIWFEDGSIDPERSGTYRDGARVGD